MLTFFRRHIKACRFTSRRDRNCKCPIHCEGKLNGVDIRRQLETRDWNTASAIIHRWERQGYIGAVNEPENRMKISDAITRYLQDCEARHLAELTLKKYRGFLIGNPDQKMTRKDIDPTPTFQTWCEAKGLTHLDQLGIEQLRAYRADWKDSLLTAIKVAQMLGNTPRIVEKHYSSWISARQEAMEARMRKSYENDPLAQAPSRKVIKIG